MARVSSKERSNAGAKGRRSAAGKGAGAKRGAGGKRVEETPQFGFMNLGGKRRGAGRKAQRRADGKRVHHTHAMREVVTRHLPVHVTLNIVAGLPSLRRADLARHVLEATAGGNERGDFRVVHFCVLSNHLHLVCEADDNGALARGMRGIGGRVAKKVNKLLGRKGRVIADRYHARALHTPTEVRNVVRYVLRNAERHEVSPDSSESAHIAGLLDAQVEEPEDGSTCAWWSGLDPLSSAAAFPHWREAQWSAADALPEELTLTMAAIVRSPRSWLLENAFNGAPLSVYEELPAVRNRATSSKPRQRDVLLA